MDEPMNKEQVLNGLNSFRKRLIEEIVNDYETRGSSYGDDRFNTWRRKLSSFLDDNLPGESSRLNAKLTPFGIVFSQNESDAEYFWKDKGDKICSYIDSLILDVKQDEYDFQITTEPLLKISKTKGKSKKVFIVHGHDGEAKEKTARFIEKLGFEAIILHEQVTKSRTIIEKIEHYSDETDFAIILYTPDDVGNKRSSSNELNFRARQNVVFEHGFLIGKLKRENVVPLVEGDIELPNDINGIVYISDKEWQIDIAKEMDAAGYDIDFNKLYKTS
jgi:predicted nucleotide-binding protein